ncbi:hypothetical protein AVEN_191562-1 [Araneus ventricosus]|uniref:Uncharacterized protein n=1 Tax=Araneus ventricosus TaxID=182803 RepID=A0A4Y2KTV0_ARAVE|nr:hypothetical protein AVEN_191562-1 [Araneus ventricosus]
MECITLWFLPMMKREEEDRLVVGETVHHPNKSWKLNISATPQKAGSKVFLSWNSGRRIRSGDSKRVDSESRFEIEFSWSRILKAALSLRRCTCSGLVP